MVEPSHFKPMTVCNRMIYSSNTLNKSPRKKNHFETKSLWWFCFSFLLELGHLKRFAVFKNFTPESDIAPPRQTTVPVISSPVVATVIMKRDEGTKSNYVIIGQQNQQREDVWGRWMRQHNITFTQTALHLHLLPAVVMTMSMIILEHHVAITVTMTTHLPHAFWPHDVSLWTCVSLKGVYQFFLVVFYIFFFFIQAPLWQQENIKQNCFHAAYHLSPPLMIIALFCPSVYKYPEWMSHNSLVSLLFYCILHTSRLTPNLNET